jgi:hypothetical protein
MRNKTFLLLLLLGFLSSTIGCKKDDEPLTCGEQLVGKWRATSYEDVGLQLIGWQEEGVGIDYFEIEFSKFNAGSNNGDIRVTYQYHGKVPAAPISGSFSPSSDCLKLDMTNFYCLTCPLLRWDITNITAERLRIEANLPGDPNKIKLSFDKI